MPLQGRNNLNLCTMMVGPTLSINSLGDDAGGMASVPSVASNMALSLSGGSPIMELTGNLSNLEPGIDDFVHINESIKYEY